MEPFEHEGTFWTVDEPERQIGGRLSYDPAEGSTLSLTGAFILDPATALGEAGKQPVRINGLAGGKVLTLEHCLLANTTIGLGGSTTARYYVRYVFAGVHFERDEEISFDDLMIRFDQLTYWVGQRPFTLSFESSEPDRLANVKTSSITYTFPDIQTAPMQGGEARLGSVQSITGDQITEMRIGHQAQLGLHYVEPRGLAGLTIDINSLQDIITLATDTPTVPEEVVLRRVDITRDRGQGVQVQIPVEMYYANAVERVRREQPRRANDILLPFEKVGGIDTIGKWIGISRQYRIIVGYLLSLRYSMRLPEENRFTNAISAAETYHRLSPGFPNVIRPKAEYKSYRRKIVKAVSKVVGANAGNWVGDKLNFANEPRLVDRLIGLANHAGTNFAAVVGDVAAWASVVTTARNRLTHQDESQPFERDIGDLTALAESLYILMLICVFKECDVTDEALANIPSTPRVRFLAGEVQSIVTRLSKYSTRRPKSSQEAKGAADSLETVEGKKPETTGGVQ